MGRGRRSRRRPPKSDAEDLLSTLPDDLLGAILRFLPSKQAARTTTLSSRWRRVWSISPLVLNVDDLPNPRSSTLSDLLSRHTGAVHSVRIDEYRLRDLDIRDGIPARLTVGEELARSSTDAFCESFRSKKIHHLHFVALSTALDATYQNLTRTLPEALIGGSSLETLKVIDCRLHDPISASRHLMHLKELNLRGDLSIDEDHFIAISALPVLVTLKLSCFYDPGEIRINSKSLKMLKLGKEGGFAKVKSIDAPNLQELTIIYLDISGEDIDAIVSNLPKLHKLAMYFISCSPLRIHSMSLKRLVIKFCGIGGLLIESPNLKYLELHNADLSESFFDKMPSNLPMLHTLDIRGINWTMSKLHITSESLQHLKIYDNTYDNTVFDEFSIIGAPNLRTVVIDGESFERAHFDIINAPKVETPISLPKAYTPH